MKKDAIFVSVASYRDDVCNSTVQSLFKNAKNPERVYVGICQQNKEDEDPDCAKDFEDNPNVKIMRISHKDAKGPTYARYFCSTMWDGEEYFLQIDSHSRFVRNWDELCINMIKEIKSQGLSEKPILSHYPKQIEDYKNYDSNNKKHTQLVPRICQGFFNNRGMISFLGAEITDSKGKYHQVPYVAAGMFFGEAKFLHELPFDPELPYVFVGEEILHSIRFYTHGWDVFTPNENVVFHEYTRKDKPKIWTDNPYYSDKDGFEKIKYIIGMTKDKTKIPEKMRVNMKKYGLGTVRSLHDFYKFAGVNLDKQEIVKNFCRKDNIGTEDDIRKSNEKNPKKENFTIPAPSTTGIEIFLGVTLSILVIISIVLFVTSNRKK